MIDILKLHWLNCRNAVILWFVINDYSLFYDYDNKINKKINIINNNCCNLKKSVI